MRSQADVATNEMQKAANRGVFNASMENKRFLVSPATMPEVLHASRHGISDEKWERQAGRRKIPAPSVPEAAILVEGTNEALDKKDDITKDEIGTRCLADSLVEKKSRLVTPATMPEVLHASRHGISDEKWERRALRRKIPAPSVPEAAILAEGTNEKTCLADSCRVV